MIKVFIIDRSPLIRFALAQLIHAESDIVVAGDGPPLDEAIRQIELSKPDILIVDIPTPRSAGIEFLKKLKKFHLPMIVFTASDETVTQDLIPILEAGAVGFVLKPADVTVEIASIKQQLLHEIRMNVRAKKSDDSNKRSAPMVKYLDPLKIVAIGSSTGGPEALMEVLSGIPKNFPFGVVVVQHMPGGFTKKFAERLNNSCIISVKEAEEGDIVSSGLVLLAPGNYHMEFREIGKGAKRTAQVTLNQDPPVWGLRPTVDRMMTSIAPIYKTNCLGVILTGMGEDGVLGMGAIKKYGGTTLVQDKSSSVVFGMAQQVIKNNLADEVVPLSKIAQRIVEITKF